MATRNNPRDPNLLYIILILGQIYSVSDHLTTCLLVSPELRHVFCRSKIEFSSLSPGNKHFRKKIIGFIMTKILIFWPWHLNIVLVTMYSYSYLGKWSCIGPNHLSQIRCHYCLYCIYSVQCLTSFYPDCLTSDLPSWPQLIKNSF